MCQGFGRAASGDKVQPIETTYINRHPTHTQTANTPHTQHTHRREYVLSPSLHMSLFSKQKLAPPLAQEPTIGFACIVHRAQHYILYHVTCGWSEAGRLLSFWLLPVVAEGGRLRATSKEAFCAERKTDEKNKTRRGLEPTTGRA